jgi:hypothetical protein
MVVFFYERDGLDFNGHKPVIPAKAGIQRGLGHMALGDFYSSTFDRPKVAKAAAQTPQAS